MTKSSRLCGRWPDSRPGPAALLRHSPAARRPTLTVGRARQAHRPGRALGGDPCAAVILLPLRIVPRYQRRRPKVRALLLGLETRIKLSSVRSNRQTYLIVSALAAIFSFLQPSFVVSFYRHAAGQGGRWSNMTRPALEAICAPNCLLHVFCALHRPWSMRHGGASN
ncbi:hypothetical protein PsYK624_127280 [Phanerochaete sordida]|uniref:Uncharacterized protein n=1 Tax=Phanerochaete sordida TaxID=48140 RepID=A0A9P3GK99_9APHY|nr:hypothetical protein PsYK624_127280 [Phanerochaete sordida]